MYVAQIFRLHNLPSSLMPLPPAIGDKDGVKLERKGAVNGVDLPLSRGTW